MKTKFQLPIIPYALIFLAAVAAYLPAFKAGFIWDDAGHVAIKAGLSASQVINLIWLTPGSVQQYYPVTHTLFWLFYKLWGLHPLGYHVVNILLHAANSVLIAVLLARLGLRTGIWTALIFALHPINVESVAWVSELKNVLSTFFYLIALISFFKEKHRAALVVFIAALLSKTTACSWPVVVLLIGFWKGYELRSLARKLIPYFVLAIAAGLLTIFVEKTYMGASGTEWTLTPVQHILLAGRILWFYIFKLIWPVPLIFIYPRWDLDPVTSLSWLAPTASLGLLSALWIQRKNAKGALVALAMYGLMIFPALGFFNVYPMRFSFVADHFLYLAGLPLILLFVEGASRFLRQVTLPVRFQSALVGLLLMSLAVTTWTRAEVFQTVESVWRDTLRFNPNSTMVNNNLGLELLKQGRVQDAEAYFRKAIECAPDAPEAYANLGYSYERQQRWLEATRWYREAAQRGSNDPSYYSRLGIAWMQTGHFRQAVEALEEALRRGELYYDRAPHWKKTKVALQLAQLKGNLGFALVKLGKTARARAEFEEALALDPTLDAIRQELSHLH